MFISWLLKFDGYPPGVVATLLLHGILLYFILPNSFEPREMVTIEPAAFVVASAVKQSPQQLRRIERLQTQQQNEEANRRQQRQAAERQQQAEAAQQREAEAQRQRQADAQRQREAEAERQRVAEENRKREAEQERQRQADAERERQADAARQRELAQQQQAAETARAAAASAATAQQLSVEQQMVAQYVQIITELVQRSWVRPPSATNEMMAVVELRLTPTGEVIDKTIVQSSGSPAFDSSVLAAVDRVGTFSELQEMPPAVFERYFRVFNLVFSPEDLLR
ncbi:MAG: hypothetical protein RLZZ227_2821 [Pseudomonadota bacterium]|jgi:colicin import membrane protein